MEHDQNELDNVSENVLRDMRSFTDKDRLKKLIQRACRHYADFLYQDFAEADRELFGNHEAALIRMETAIDELSAIVKMQAQRIKQLEATIG